MHRNFTELHLRSKHVLYRCQLYFDCEFMRKTTEHARLNPCMSSEAMEGNAVWTEPRIASVVQRWWMTTRPTNLLPYLLT